MIDTIIKTGAQLLAEQILADEDEVVHAARSFSMKKPLSRCSVRRAYLRGGRIVGHHDDGLAEIAVEDLEHREDLVGAGAVEIAGRLVAQQELRIGDDRAGNGHALLLPARHFTRIVVGPVGEIDDLERGRDALAPRLGAKVRQQQRQFDVLRSAEHRHQIVELKDEADVGRAPAGEIALR